MRKRLSRAGTAVGLGLAIIAMAPGPVLASILWGSTGSSNADGGGRIYTIDTVTQTVTLVGDTGLDRVGGLAFDGSGTLFGVSGGAVGPATLYTIDTGSAAATLVGTISGISGVDALAFNASGTLWAGGWNGSSGVLLTVDPTSGAILTSTLMSGSGNNLAVGLAFDPAGTLFGSRGNSNGHTEDLVTIDTTTGAHTAVGGSTNIISDLAFGSDGVLYGSEPASGAGNIYSIDPATGAKTFLFATNTVLSGLTAAPAASAPEPSTLGIVALSLGILVAGRRRRPA